MNFINRTVATAVLLVLSAPVLAGAQTLDSNQGAIDVTEPSGAPQKGGKVGRKAAEKYMAPKKASSSSAPAAPRGPANHYLALHVGSFISDNAYLWGSPDSQSNVGRLNLGVTYRVGEWTDSMDLGIRVDFQSFALGEGRANKLSFLPIITFPDANSKFPLYFGAGAGLGVFLNQISAESALSLDYQLFAGVRFFDVLNTTGFFVEAGLKNHFLIVSNGQFNGTFAAAGLVFTF